MLQSILQDYLRTADNTLKFDWRKIPRHELVYKCCEYQGKDEVLFNAYLSAVYVRYWDCIKLYANRGGKAYTAIEVYDWLTDSIIETIRTRLWENPQSTLYKDNLAPEKSIKVRLRSHMQGRFQFVNYAKRSGAYNGTTFELDKIIDDEMEDDLPRDESFENNLIIQSDVGLFVKSSINDANYVDAFVADGILYGDVFNKSAKCKINHKKMFCHIKNIDDEYMKKMSVRYDIDFDKLRNSYECVKALTPKGLSNRFHKAMLTIKNNFKEELN